MELRVAGFIWERHNRKLAAVFILALAWLCASVRPVGAATFTASLDRDAIVLGETATLSLKFSGGAPKDAPSLPAIPNLQIDYVGPSSEFSFINGQVSSTVTHNFRVTPR